MFDILNELREENNNNKDITGYANDTMPDFINGSVSRLFEMLRVCM